MVISKCILQLSKTSNIPGTISRAKHGDDAQRYQETAVRKILNKVTIPELHGCMTHGKTYEEAVRQGQDAIATWIEGSQERGLPIPPPKILKIA